MKKVLVTGAAGFIGRAVLRQLATHHDVVVVAFDANLAGVQDGPRLIGVRGDITDAQLVTRVIDDGIDAVLHLAAVPGGAAEDNPLLSQRVNVEASLHLFSAIAARAHAAQQAPPRVVFASTIAVYGDPLPAQGVDDATPLRPRLIYGAHKAMMEIMVATWSRRNAIDGVSLRIPGIVARPLGPSGMKSAFMSNLFHALRAGQKFVAPVSPAATLWLMSVERCAENLVRGLRVDGRALPETRALALPALRISMAELVDAVAAATGAAREAVSYEADAALEAAFGAHPSLSTAVADAAGFTHDGDLTSLVARALSEIDGTDTFNQARV